MKQAQSITYTILFIFVKNLTFIVLVFINGHCLFYYLKKESKFSNDEM